MVKDADALELFSKHLEDTLIRNENLLPKIQDRAKNASQPSYLRTDTTLQTTIPVRVDVYHEMSLKRTIIEIEANDKIGLLYTLSRIITKHGFDITFARISTEKKVAVDTFYIEPSQPGTEEENSDKLIKLKEKLLEVLEPSQTESP